MSEDQTGGPTRSFCYQALATVLLAVPVHGSVRKPTWVVRLGKGNYSAVNAPNVFC
jgi:hypothetical protein